MSGRKRRDGCASSKKRNGDFAFSWSFCYDAGNSGSECLSRFCDLPFLRLALIGTFVASLGLAACGRKGPLDPPPASLVNGEKVAPGNAGIDANGLPQAPKGPNKHIPLDVLLN